MATSAYSERTCCLFQLRSQLENDLLDAQSRIEDLEKLLKAQGKVRHCQVQSNLRGRYVTPMYIQSWCKMHVLGQEPRLAFRPLCSVALDSVEILCSVTPYTEKLYVVTWHWPMFTGHRLVRRKGKHEQSHSLRQRKGKVAIFG